MTVQSLDLSGIDGANPLGFLAALGTLVTIREAGENHARLRWKRSHVWTPVLEGISESNPDILIRTLVGALRGRTVSDAEDQTRQSTERAHEQAMKAVKDKKKEIRDRHLNRTDSRAAVERELHPLNEVCAQKRDLWLTALEKAVPRPELAIGNRIDCTPDEYRRHVEAFLPRAAHNRRETLDLLAAFGSDACRDERSQVIEATPFCFIRGSGHQFFLDTVRQLLGHVTPEAVWHTLMNTWAYRDETLSMRWDPSEDRRYALMDRDPTASDNKSRTVWMANLLGYRALVLFPCAPGHRGLATTAWAVTEEGEPAFTWPIWEFAASPDTIRSLLQLAGLAQAGPGRSQMKARGIAAIYRSRRLKVGSGANYKMNFSPSRGV